MIVEVISTGTELMRGTVIPTNLSYIAKSLIKLGIEIKYHSCYLDNLMDISNGIQNALKRADIVIITGGLGPTADDFTREAFAKVFNSKLVLNKDIWKWLKNRFRKYHLKLTKDIIKQTYFPEDSRVIPNSIGSAPGFYIEKNSKYLFALSGVPREMACMFEESVIPVLKRLFSINKSNLIRDYKIFGLTEAEVEEKIKPIFSNKRYKLTPPNFVNYGLTAKIGDVTLTINVNTDNQHLSKKMISVLDKIIKKTFGNFIIGDRSSSLESIVGTMLINVNQTIAIAESCTGGLISHKLTQIPGISKSLLEDIVSYSNESKVKRLCVPKDLIIKYGAVSCEIAEAMAKGIAKSNNADFGLSTTGIAGPQGGSKQKPVGLVYIGLYNKACDKTWVSKFIFAGEREQVKERAANWALNLLRLHLLKFKSK